MRRKAHRIGIYGTGGIGKTSLAESIRRVGLNPKFCDLEHGAEDLDVEYIDGINTWADLLSCLGNPSIWKPDDVPVIDTLSKAEELATLHTIATVKKENKEAATSLESYGFGKGYQHLMDTFMQLLAALDRHHERGRNVIVICHDDKSKVPNPSGDDWLRWEPKLTSYGRASLREAVKNWCDHLFFVKYDVAVKDDGVAVGAGSRFIYTQEQAQFLAKSRTLSKEYKFDKGSAQLWADLFGKAVQ